jgi:hypothetical protein
MTAALTTIHAQRCNTDKQGSNTVADNFTSFSVLTGTTRTQEFEAQEEENFYPMRITDHAPVLDASFVRIYCDGEADPPPAYRFVVRLDPTVQKKMNREMKVTLSFDFQYIGADPDVLEKKTQDFSFDLDAEKAFLDGFCYIEFLFVCGNTDLIEKCDLGEIHLFQLDDDSGLGFPAFITVWPGTEKTGEAITLPVVEMLPDIEVSDYLASDLDRYIESGEFPDTTDDTSDFEASEEVLSD